MPACRDQALTAVPGAMPSQAVRSRMPQLWEALHRVERDSWALRGDERGHRLAGPPHLQMQHPGISLTHAQPIQDVCTVHFGQPSVIMQTLLGTII